MLIIWHLLLQCCTCVQSVNSIHEPKFLLLLYWVLLLLLLLLRVCVCALYRKISNLPIYFKSCASFFSCINLFFFFCFRDKKKVRIQNKPCDYISEESDDFVYCNLSTSRLKIKRCVVPVFLISTAPSINTHNVRGHVFETSFVLVW